MYMIVIDFCYRGLKIVLQTGNMTSYPDTCSKATASFAVLSETIKAIQEILLNQQRQRTDFAKLLSQLQGLEKEKLHLTAAHHLERIRQRNHQIQEVDDSNTRIAKLLDDGVLSLHDKIQTCVEQINDVLEEIRSAVLEED